MKRCLEDESCTYASHGVRAVGRQLGSCTTDMLEECQKLIVQRQGSIDDDQNDKNLAEDTFAAVTGTWHDP